MTKFRPALVELGIWIAITATAFGLTFQFNEPLEQYRYGAAGWPRVIIYGIVFFALIQMIWRFIGPERKGAIMGMAEDHIDAATPLEARSIKVHLKHFATFAAPLLYLYLVPRMGFYILTPFFIGGYMRLLGETRLRYLVGTTLLIYALTILIFLELLFVPLPVGNWPGFYDINSLFVSVIK
jgi:hypothetical protein